MKKIIKWLFGLLLVWGITHSIYIVWDGIQDKKINADVAVIFGNKVHKDGTLSESLALRMKQGLTLYHSGRVKYIIVSGGLGKEGYWEAEKMQEYLIANQVPKEAIFIDNYGNDTELTVVNSLKLMKENNWQSAISVSQYFHQTRIKMLYHKNGFEQIESSSPTTFILRDIYSIAREFVAFYVELLK